MDIAPIALIAFVVAGFVKGVLGFGFPIIALIILTLAIGLFDALATIVIPTIATNIWQATAGPYLREILQRMWLYFAVALSCIFLTSFFIISINVNWLTALLGSVLFFYALSRLLNLHISVRPEQEKPLSILFGAANGLLTGFTGSFMVPSVLYMQALGFGREMLIQAMGVFFALSTAMLTVSLGRNELISNDQAILSTLALIPAFAGLFVGRWVRLRIDEVKFQRIFLIAVLVLGAFLVARSIPGL